MNYTKISRQLIQSLSFRAFTQNDYYGFSGVSSPIPLIAELESEGILMIIDGDTAELYADTSDGSFEPIDICDNIRDLPYKTEVQLAAEAEIAKLEASIAKLKTLL